MITLEQIRLLEGKISRALELIHSLKEENATLRKGLESAQRRMKELEVMVDGFKSDQKEIESVIVRTLHNLDELEENSAAKHQERGAGTAPAAAPASPPRSAEHGQAPAPSAAQAVHEPSPHADAAAPVQAPSAQAAAPSRPAPAVSPDHPDEHDVRKVADAEPRPPKEELDIF
jgi:peptidoglycan hydrolase CwlO-like protein